jgi:hypothetical protein
MRTASEQLREQGKDQAAKPMEQAAQRVESAGRWLRDSDGDRILHDVEDFGRRNPLAVAAGGLAIGFALSRLLKASSSDRYHGRTTPPTGGNGNGRAPLPQPVATPRPATSPPGPATSGPGANPGAVPDPGRVPPMPPASPDGPVHPTPPGGAGPF